MSGVKFSRSFRITASPSEATLVLELLAEEGFASGPEPFSPMCRRLDEEPFPLGSSLAARFGYIYIQDRSSMLPPLLLAPPPGAAVLDMAASPGGKSGFLAQLTGPEGVVLANEPAGDRVATLRANLRRANLLWGATCQYPGEKLPLAAGSWNHIALDPPCSGWGTVARHPRTLKIWRGGKVAPLISLQRALLRRAAELLRPGGRLLYSTCTTNPGENENQTAWALAELGLEARPITPPAGFVFEPKPHGGMLVNGEASGAQGFYLSLMGKPEGGGVARAPEETGDFTAFELLAPTSLASDIFDPARLPPGSIGLFNGKARFLPRQAAAFPPGLRWQGMLLGNYANGNFRPEPSLRCALPPVGPRLVFDTAGEVRSFLSGAAFKTNLPGTCAGLWLRDLPLGSCLVKNGRPISAL